MAVFHMFPYLKPSFIPLPDRSIAIGLRDYAMLLYLLPVLGIFPGSVHVFQILPQLP